MNYRFAWIPTALLVCADIASAQTLAKVDFAKEIQSIFRQNCIGCHGPAMQQGGMRMDRRSSAMKPFSRRVSAGSSQNSILYHRISGTEYGPQMPPTGALRPEQIGLVKDWIDQGANWPDALANESDLPPLNLKAVTMVELLRTGNMTAFLKEAASDPKLLNARGPGGSTPFMYAVIYSNAAILEKLLKHGADPNKRNDANATALMWAARDFEKTKLLVEHGADVNAKSDDLRTPLLIAARRPGAAPVVKLLLDHKADPNPNPRPATESSPLLEALTGGDLAIVQLLMERGADAKATADMGLAMAVIQGCQKCLDLVSAKIAEKDVYTAALQNTAFVGDVRAMRLMLDRGADVNAFDPLGRTPLMYAVVSDLLPVDAVKLLIERGADVNAVNRHKKSGDAGVKVLDIALRNGHRPIIQMLETAGAKATPEAVPRLKPRAKNTIRSAVQDSIPLLQRTDASFSTKAGCVSCHNNSMGAMAVSLARSRGLRIDEKIAAEQVRVNVASLEKRRELMYQGFGNAVGDNFMEFVWSYVLLGLHAEQYPPDLNTDAVVTFLLSRQSPAGDWPSARADTRPPMGLTFITQTAISMRAIQVYAPKPMKSAAERAVRMATAWMANAKPGNNDDSAWRLTGLAWAGLDRAAIQAARTDLLAAQRPDGGWSDLPSMPSSAYATGRSLAALHTGGLQVFDPAYQRGIKYLLETQQEDGSWYVKTRALAFQPGFDADFPHGPDQFISAAGTSWAAMALSFAVPEVGPVRASRIP